MGFVLTALLLVVCLSFDNAHAADCTPTELQPCMKDISAMQGMDLSQGPGNEDMMGKVCGIFTCMLNLNCDLPEQASQMMEQPQMKSAKVFCEGMASGGGCSMVNLQKCGSMEDFKDMKDPKIVCSAMMKYQKCISDLLPACKDNPMEANLKQVLAQMKPGIESLGCSATATATATSTDTGATGCNFVECQKYVKNVHTEPSEMCNASKLAYDCMKEEESKCTGKQKEQITMVLKNLAPMVAKDCCDVFVKVNTNCIQGNEQLINETTFQPKDDQCQKLETLFTCIQPYKPKCPKSLMEGHQKGREAINDNLKSCEQKGYKVTVDYKGNGVGLLPTAAVLISALFASLVTFGF